MAPIYSIQAAAAAAAVIWGNFLPPGKFEMRVHFWKTDPTSTHAFLNGGWPGALQMHFCLLLKPEEGFSFSHSTVQGRGTETAWRATKLCKRGNIDTGAEESEKQHKVLSFR